MPGDLVIAMFERAILVNRSTTKEDLDLRSDVIEATFY